MKIGIVSPYGYPHPGGVNEHIRLCAEGLKERGHDIRVITGSFGDERESAVEVIRFGTSVSFPANGSTGRLTFGRRFASQARIHLLREGFDVLHFHEPFVPFLSTTLLGQSKATNVATFHAYAGSSLSYRVGKHVLGNLDSRLQARIAVSPASKHFISQYFPGPYRVIPLGVDLSRFESAEPYSGLSGRFNVLFVGRLEERKGLSHLLRAFRTIKSTVPEARLLICGEGARGRWYRNYVRARRIPDVEFLGRVSDTEKLRYLRSADVFVAPSTGQESFGFVLLEALAAGLPIVASDIHGYKHVVRRNLNALLVPPGDSTAIAAALVRLAQDPSLRRTMAAANAARALSFDHRQIAAKLEQVYLQASRGTFPLA